jgi:hypothetical protein
MENSPVVHPQFTFRALLCFRIWCKVLRATRQIWKSQEAAAEESSGSEECMTKVVQSYEAGCLYLPAMMTGSKRNALGLSTADFRRILCDLKHRPPTQRVFLRRLLRRALANGRTNEFPVVHHAVPDPVSPA